MTFTGPHIDSTSGEAGRRPVVLGIAGSLREGSFHRALLRAAGELAADAVTLKIYEGLGEVPPFNEDAEGAPAAAVTALRRSIEEADAVLVATPEYNNSIPGVLKNALDWASRPYRASSLVAKPMAVIGASPGESGAAQAQADLRRVLRACGAEVVDDRLEMTRVHRGFDEAGRLVDDEARTTLSEIMGRLVATADAEAASARD